MAHVSKNFQTKKAFKEAVKAGQAVYVQDNPIFGSEVKAGVAYISGPWEYHKWYAQVKVNDEGQVVSVK